MKIRFKKNSNNLIINIWPILVLLIVSIVLLRCFFKPGFPATHDGQSHIARLANFHLAVVDRHFPVRWARNLNYKFGYPVFHFNYYTPYVLALVPGKLGFSFESSFKMVFVFSLFAGGLFWYLLLKPRLGKIAALTGGLFYITAPYQLVNILIRGSVGEIVALGLLPFLLWSLDRLLNHTSRLTFFISSMGIMILFLTHNITAIFGTPILGLFCLALILEKRNWQKLWLAALTFVPAIGMTLFFWVPAMFEKKFSNMDLIGMSHEYLKHFPTLGQLIYSPWQYGFSVPGSQDGMPFELGPFHWLVAIAAAAIFVKTFLKKKKIDWLFVFFLSVFSGSIIFMNQASSLVWKVMPMVHYIQFPWRLLGFSLLGIGFLSAWFTSKYPKVGIVLAIGAIGYMAYFASPVGGWFNWNNYFYYEWPFTSSIKGLNMPKWFNLDKNHELIGKIFELPAGGSVKELEWKTQKHRYEIDTPEKTKLFERTAYFPGWEVYVDGKQTKVDYENKKYPGMISFTLPAGKHLVEIIFGENTPARKFGDIASMLSFAIFGAVLLFGKFLDENK